MAKKAIVEIQCERCPRTEYIDPEVTKTTGPTTITFEGVTHTFTDLCSACHKAVAAHVEGIVRKLDGRSPERKAKKKEEPAVASPPPAQPSPAPHKPPTHGHAGGSGALPRTAG